MTGDGSAARTWAPGAHAGAVHHADGRPDSGWPDSEVGQDG